MNYELVDECIQAYYTYLEDRNIQNFGKYQRLYLRLDNFEANLFFLASEQLNKNPFYRRNHE